MIEERSRTHRTLSAAGRATRWQVSGDVGQDPQVTTTGAAAVVGGVPRRLRAGSLADGVGKGQQVVAGRTGILGVDLVPDDLPAARHGPAGGGGRAEGLGCTLGN